MPKMKSSITIKILYNFSVTYHNTEQMESSCLISQKSQLNKLIYVTDRLEHLQQRYTQHVLRQAREPFIKYINYISFFMFIYYHYFKHT